MGDAEAGGGDLLLSRRRGKCKWFNVAKGWGFITPSDGGPDVFVHQSVIQMSGFRSLGEAEEVSFESRSSDKGLEATAVSGPEGGDCKGSHRRPLSKKRFKKIRCYNCGEFANHIAAKCALGPQPKRCHHCKSSDHLIADCPDRLEKQFSPTDKHTNNNNNDTNCRDDSGGFRHRLAKVILDNDDDDEDDDEDVQLHDHRINCSSSPASSCSSPMGKRDL